MPSNENLTRVFLALRDEAIELRVEYNDFVTLFDSDDETRDLLSQVAAAFFDRMGRVLMKYLYGRIGVLTDPPENGSQRNLTVRHLNDLLLDAGLMTPAIEAPAKALQRYRELILPARNKLIAHLDREHVLAGSTLGAHSADEVPRFFDALQEYFDEAGRAVGVGPSDFRVQAHPGDAKDLVENLRSLLAKSRP